MGLEMALNEIFTMCYVIDSQNDEGNGELGWGIANTMTNSIYFIICKRFQLIIISLSIIVLTKVDIKF